MAANKQLLKFIKQARERGFDDYQVREPLLRRGWPADEVERAFFHLKPRYKFKNKINIFVDSDVLKIIEKRAKKNMFTLPEQIEDILRRSCIRARGIAGEKEKLDDMLITLFSRRQRGNR